MIHFHDHIAQQCLECVTEETMVQNLYWLTHFYRLIKSTGISPTPCADFVF